MSFAALALHALAANDTTRAQINNIPSKSHFIVLLTCGVISFQFGSFIAWSLRQGNVLITQNINSDEKNIYL